MDIFEPATDGMSLSHKVLAEAVSRAEGSKMASLMFLKPQPEWLILLGTD